MTILEAGLGIWGEYARQCLLWFAVAGLVLFGLPIMLWPLRWARLLGWRVAQNDHLALYFGRTLGMLTCSLCVVNLLALDRPALWPMLFNLNMLIFLANTLVHAWGAIKRIQPPAENWEIPYWLALACLQYLFYPATHWAVG
jgi:hypothetical protein